MVKTRSEIDTEDKWNVEALFPNLETWEDAFLAIAAENKRPRWPKLGTFKNRLGECASTFKSALDLHMNLSREIEKLLTYAQLRHDEELTEDKYKSAYQRVLSLYHDYLQESSWLEPEILSLPEGTLRQYLASPSLASYQFHLQKIIHLKKYTLSPEKEELLAQAATALETPQKTFNALNNADLSLGTIQDSQGQRRELTHGLYQIYVRDRDRELRKNAFQKLHRKYKGLENTLCELLNGQMQSHLLSARGRGYSTCLEAALFPQNIPLEVYYSLIRAVRENISALHSYLQVRKQALGVEELHLYDLHVPLTKELNLRFTYSEAEELAINASAPLGEEYQSLLRTGLQKERWIDRYENKHKRSGAYSSGCYDSMPYILLNFEGLISDVFTLAHEAGHSMHSLLSKRHQPYHYASYPIFLAEVASTFNEALLIDLMLKRAESKEEKVFLLCQQIERLQSTLFRQTMFAEFELFLHTQVEQDMPLTPAVLKSKYLELNQFYFGNEVVIDEEIEIEWARIPHFYYNFYVYQYATGISAAFALVDRVLKGGHKEQDDYLNFLKSGCSKFPIDLLKGAGVDVTSEKPVQSLIGNFVKFVDELKTLI